MQKEVRQSNMLRASFSVFVALLILLLLSSITMGQYYAYIGNTGLEDEVQDDLSVVDLATNTVIATVPVGHYPQGVVVNPAGTAVYVANTGDNSFTVIDVPEFTSTTIAGPGGVGASGVDIHPNGRRIYVTNPEWYAGGAGSTVWVIDRATHEIIDEIACGMGSCGITVHPDGEVAYVSNALEGTIAVFDTETHAVLDTIELETVGENEAAFPVPIVVNPAGTFVYAANRVGPTYWAINTTTHEVVTKSCGNSYVCMGIHPDGSAVYLSDFQDAEGTTVNVIDTKTLDLVATIDGMSGPLGVTVHPEQTRLYVVNGGSDSVAVIDAATGAHITDIAVGTNPESYGQFIGPGVPHLLKADAVARLEAVKTTIEGGAEGVVSPSYAIEHLEAALEVGHASLAEALWSASEAGALDPRRLQADQGDTLFASSQTMVQAILDAIRRGWIMDTEIRDELLACVDAAVRADRVLAAVAIDDAIVAGADSDALDDAQEILDQAKALIKEAAVWSEIHKKASLLTDAIAQCQNAWQAARALAP